MGKIRFTKNYRGARTGELYYTAGLVADLAVAGAIAMPFSVFAWLTAMAIGALVVLTPFVIRALRRR